MTDPAAIEAAKHISNGSTRPYVTENELKLVARALLEAAKSNCQGGPPCQTFPPCGGCCACIEAQARHSAEVYLARAEKAEAELAKSNLEYNNLYGEYTRIRNAVESSGHAESCASSDNYNVIPCDCAMRLL